MPLFNRKPRHTPANKRPVKPGFITPRATLWLVTGLLAAFAVFQWALPIWQDGQHAYAVFIGAVFGGSAMVTPAIVEKLIHARWFALVGLILVCAAFGALDSVGLGVAFQRFEAQATAEEWQRLKDAHASDRSTALQAVTTAQTVLSGVTLDLSGNPGPQTTQAREAAFKTARDAAEHDLERARADLQAWDRDNPAPARPDLFDDRLINIIAAGLQLALMIGFGCLEATRSQIHRKALAKWQAEQDKRAADRRQAKLDQTKAETALAKAKAKQSPTEQAKARAETALAEPRPVFRPHLVAANDLH